METQRNAEKYLNENEHKLGFLYSSKITKNPRLENRGLQTYCNYKYLLVLILHC